MKKTKNKSYGRVFNAAQSLISQKILNSQKIGMSNICTINLNNEKTINYFCFLDSLDISEKVPQELSQKVQSLIPIIPAKYFTLIIDKNQLDQKIKRLSIDVFILVDNEIDSMRVLNIIENHCNSNNLEIKPHVLHVSEFLSLVNSPDANYIKSLIKNNFIFYGSQNYYHLIKEAISHGFKF
jgi:hypothetical protein